MKKKKLFGDNLKERLVASAKDRVYSFLLADKTVRGAVVYGTRMVNEMRANHELGILETLVLGHAYLAASLLTINLKNDDRICLQIDCSGPIKGLAVEANSFGEVRGYLKQVPIPINKPLESFDLSPFFGAGFLTVTRHLENSKHPFSGNIALEYGTIAKDLANYYLTSEQIPTAVNLSIQFDTDGVAIGAGGLLLQAMPGANESLMEDLEKEIKELPSLGMFFAKDGDPHQLILKEFESFSPDILDDYRIEFMCPCNEERVRNLLMGLPMDDLEDIHQNGPFPVEVRCHNCNSQYIYEQAEIEPILQERRSLDALQAGDSGAE